MRKFRILRVNKVIKLNRYTYEHWYSVKNITEYQNSWQRNQHINIQKEKFLVSPEVLSLELSSSLQDLSCMEPTYLIHIRQKVIPGFCSLLYSPVVRKLAHKDRELGSISRIGKNFSFQLNTLCYHSPHYWMLQSCICSFQWNVFKNSSILLVISIE